MKRYPFHHPKFVLIERPFNRTQCMSIQPFSAPSPLLPTALPLSSQKPAPFLPFILHRF